ncbi:phage gp6-like head-tail connector protein [Priestia flexa]|uniref:phage gp6-like head-tail connector protein n=1 Tax=Priestia flexa TaxID=86664 RepID=UPI00240DF63F|nr:phage gp6-like head-tail connector protein [Priestia flexa]WEZ09575.1 phage gp6-like head-tail connector protein [Priestia flexa]
MNNVTDELLQEFKDMMHFTHNSEDSNLHRLLSFSIDAIKRRCGKFDIDVNLGARELVLQRTRYAYNDAVEYFDKNFSSEIINVQLDIAFNEMDEEGEMDA